jgi:hypothetical protein
VPAVFVIMPFDEAWDDLYELGIKEGCERAGAECSRLDEQIFDEAMLDRIHGQIVAADLIVAEMTDPNRNVYYEAGYAHGRRKRIIFLARDADDIPFDLKHHRHIVHGGRIAELRDAIEQNVRHYLEHPEDRPVDDEHAEQDRMAQHIDNYLKANRFQKVSFERIRDNLNEGYTDQRLQDLIDLRPEHYRRVRMKGNRPGLGLVD